MALVKEYFELTKRYQKEYGENTILLMQVGSFFEVYGTKDCESSKIREFSQICDLNIAEKNDKLGNIIMAGFKDIMIERYIRKIQEVGFTAVVYTQLEQGGQFIRNLAGVFSPGTYFSNDQSKITNNLSCIWVDLVENHVLLKGKYVVVGVSNIDIYTGKTSMFQFKESYTNNPTNFDELERFISIYNPSEVIIISNLSENEIDDVVSFTNINAKCLHRIDMKDERIKNCSKQSYQKEILTKFFQIENYDSFIYNFNEQHIATQSFCYLLDFVFQHNPFLVRKISEPIFENCDERLVLANHSLKQLNIIDDSNSGCSGKFSSVLTMLNICMTSMGRRLFAYNLLNPTTNVADLQREYDITEYLINNKYDEFKHLADIKDLEKCKRLLIMRKITPSTFVQLYDSILLVSNLYEIVKNDVTLCAYLKSKNIDIETISNHCKTIATFINERIELEIARTIDTNTNFDTNFIKTNVDAILDNKNTTLADSETKLESIRKYLNGIIESREKKATNTDYIKLHETEKNNYSLLCTIRRCKLLEDSLPIQERVEVLEKNYEFIVSRQNIEFHKQSGTNNSIVNPQINGLCKTITGIKTEMKEIISDVFYKIIDAFDFALLDDIIQFVTFVDIVNAKSKIAIKHNFCKPVFDVTKDKSFFRAKKLRHCLIEQIHTSELYVTNDLVLGEEKTDGILLYGTNAVGKTSLIRSVGIAVIMAQAGLYVPCAEFIYKPYKHIFTRIIGNDNLFKGLSTFAVEMSELRTILRNANENSMVLGDELCSGTENISAVSIFVAGIQKLYNLKSSFIFATHFHEITKYDEVLSCDTLKLKHMTIFYNRELDKLVYDRKLKDGPGDSMYGLEVCKSLNLPMDFLELANNIRCKYHPETRSFLSLNQSRYNSEKLVGICEKCKVKMGTEVHHLNHQKYADVNGIIDQSFHKNSLGNLMTLCEKCHLSFHS